jgi:hypothetical protein
MYNYLYGESYAEGFLIIFLEAWNKALFKNMKTKVNNNMNKGTESMFAEKTCKDRVLHSIYIEVCISYEEIK